MWGGPDLLGPLEAGPGLLLRCCVVFRVGRAGAVGRGGAGLVGWVARAWPGWVAEARKSNTAGHADALKSHLAELKAELKKLGEPSAAVAASEGTFKYETYPF